MFWQQKVDFILVNYATHGYEICVALLIWTWGRLTCETVIWVLHLLLFSVLDKSVSMSHTNSSDTKLFLLVSCDLSIWERCMEVSSTVEIHPRKEWQQWRIRLGERNRKWNHTESGSPSCAPFNLDLTKCLWQILEIHFSQDIDLNIGPIFLNPRNTERIWHSVHLYPKGFIRSTIAKRWQLSKTYFRHLRLFHFLTQMYAKCTGLTH